MRTPLLYALHSGNLYGTERMALATAAQLADEYAAVVLAPPGAALEEAARMGFECHAFENAWQFARALRPHLARSGRLAFLATGVAHSLACLACNAVYRRRFAHLHMVHGGADERLSYGRKRLLNRAPVYFVAVSEFVRSRLLAHGVNGGRVRVIENFLSDDRVRAAPRRAPFRKPGIRRVVVVSRLDPIKRVDLLLDALERDDAPRDLEVRVLGTGWEEQKLRARARAARLPVMFEGFRGGVENALAEADLLAHLCPEEPFGLAILEAMAAGVPALVPDRGGAGALVEDGVSGFRFAADDAASLAARLSELELAPPERLNAAVEGGRRALASRFSAAARAADYRRLIEEVLA